MKKTSLSHIVNETVVHLNKNKDPVTILPTKAVGVLRNRSVEWLVNGCKAINTPRIVKMVHAPHCICLWISLMVVKDLGYVQSWRDQPFVRVFDVSRSSSGPCSSSQHESMPPQAPLGHNGSYPEDKMTKMTMRSLTHPSHSTRPSSSLGSPMMHQDHWWTSLMTRMRELMGLVVKSLVALQQY